MKIMETPVLNWEDSALHRLIQELNASATNPDRNLFLTHLQSIPYIQFEKFEDLSLWIPCLNAMDELFQELQSSH